MSDERDIVERLLERAGQNDAHDWHGDIEREAAACITALREQLTQLRGVMRLSDDAFRMKSPAYHIQRQLR